MTEQHLALFRRHMVEIIDMHFDLAEEEIGKGSIDAAVRRALNDVPRHLFVPSEYILAAYQDTPLPIGFDKTVSQPFIGALMIELLELEPEDSVLEVGTGLGYQAAVMAEMGAKIFSVEVVEEFAEAAIARFALLGHDVKVRVGDGARGWSEYAPFDAVLVSAAATEPPQPLLDQLRPGGRMVIPIGDKSQQQLCVVHKRSDGAIDTRQVMDVKFTQLELD